MRHASVKRALLLLLTLVSLSGCSAPAGSSASAVSLTGEQVASSLRESGLPVQDIVIFTPQTDPNGYLGRPGQYVVKVSWKDTRQTGTSTIELFEALDLAQARAIDVQRITEENPALRQYIYHQRGAVLRVPTAGITADQAKEYESWLTRLVA